LKKCPSCGTENPDESTYCVKCGALLAGSGETSTPAGASGPYSGEVVGGPPSEKKSKWWIWLIIAIAAVLLIGIICCCIAAGCGMITMPFSNQ
jgi:uncharacterized membrane protein YvbJ